MPPNSVRCQPASNDSGHAISADDSLDQLIEATPYIDYEVSSGELFAGAFKIVSTVFPSWDEHDIKFVQCKDGITNQLVRVTHRPTDFSVLVRAFGRKSEILIDRKQEIINLVTLSARGLCPPLYARFRNGLMYGFINGRVSTVEELGQPKTAAWIANKAAKWHKVLLPQDQTTSGKPAAPKQTLWSTMRRWLADVPTQYDDPEQQKKFNARFDVQKLSEEFENLAKVLETLDSPVVFSHNDLLYGNVIYDDEKEEASFIDYEYGGYAFRGFDIGNHFNEFAGFECDYSRYPDKPFQMQWFEWYLTEFNGVAPTHEELEHLYKEVEGFSLASHYYWGLWALIQAKISTIEFDYMSYAALRFDEYERRKRTVFPSSL
ncbi:kinase-like domain-containing protein [Zychaea mexicana]|uniref:kinase-like domain-containing protein n=1 Tax=Zychaea mexicana TaxID=64656 RepID=UPI0022FDF4C9|nr:kinase-like domain-containing protein [Zychaea mexicana]KAI9492724.1 kinase-like domain-containing protein [Zychaea mexicana]